MRAAPGMPSHSLSEGASPPATCAFVRLCVRQWSMTINDDAIREVAGWLAQGLIDGDDASLNRWHHNVLSAPEATRKHVALKRADVASQRRSGRLSGPDDARAIHDAAYPVRPRASAPTGNRAADAAHEACYPKAA